MTKAPESIRAVSPQRANELAAIALEVARDAGRVAAAGFRRHPNAIEKKPNDLVTEYDLASERRIRERLAVLTPSIPVVGEEQGGERSAELTWYCDPIDGTMNFVHGHPFWCVSIGLLSGADAIAGAVVAPALGDEWLGALGHGALRNGAPAVPRSTSELSQALVATGFPAPPAAPPPDNFDRFARVGRAVRGVRRCGSAALDLCFVADGTYDAYWERGLSPWDVAGGVAIALSAGARVSDFNGGPLDVQRGDVVVSNGKIHDQLLRLITGV